nr:hypothetical protein BaRGS_000728 [Batillaria attramentaria]
MCILLGQTFTARKVIMIGGTMGAIGMSLGSLLVSMNYVILVFGIWFGFGNSTIYGNVLVMLSTYFRKRRTLANGLALTGASIGQFALPPFFEYLLETLLAVVVVDFVGLKNMPRLLAVIMLLQGIGASLGQPLLVGYRTECRSGPVQLDTALSVVLVRSSGYRI